LSENRAQFRVSTQTSSSATSTYTRADKSSSSDISNACAIVLLTDWLPPEFSAVSQYAELIAREEAVKGANVVLVGTRSTEDTETAQPLGPGSLRIIGIRRPMVMRRKWFQRLIWAFATNVALVARAWPYLRSCEVIRFSGAPPFMLHVVSAANVILRKRMVYRVTDFYPECITAALGREPFLLKGVRILTYWLRRRVDQFEVLGLDMKRRILECGVDPERVVLRRDGSPVEIRMDTMPLPLPDRLKGKKTLLYSGNWGVAHDVDTFVTGYAKHHREGSGNVVLWLNATGAGADEVARRLSAATLPFLRQDLVSLADLPRLLVTPDAHLITLRPSFAGLVLPSKVYGCIESARPIIYVGPRRSDIHLLCEGNARARYFHADVGDPDALAGYLELV
jgi:hypothetical protein